MSAVNTDAKVPTLLRGTNLINTGGSSSNNQVMRVRVNGKSHFVQIRLNKDGGYAAVAVQRNEIEIQGSPTRTNPSGISKSKVDRPWVLFTVNADGERTYGGKGRSYNVSGEGQLGNLAGDLLPNQGKLETTTETQALAQIGTATVNGETVTLNEFQDLAYVKAKVLSKSAEDPFSSRQASERGVPDAFIPAQSPTAEIELEVTPHNAEDTSDPGDVKETEEQPGNNDGAAGASDAAEPGATNIGQEFAIEVGDKAKGFIGAIGEFLGNAPITPEEIAQFDKMFADGGGDKIQNGMYPLDANYGNIRGQDYVTIDQFIYQPPRRDQIFGDTIGNLRYGSQRETPLKHFLAQVKLPMPNDIQDSNQISWGPDKMNNLSAAITSGVMRNPVLVGGIGAALGTFNPALGQMGALLAAGMAQSGGIDGNESNIAKAQAIAKQLSSSPGGSTLLKSNLGSMMLGAMGVNVSPESILARGFGVIPNSNTELLFDNIKLRTFEFNWRMSPRDEKEADEVKKIIRFFKQGMAAKTMTSTAGERSLYLGSPNVFRLQYRTAGGDIIEGVNRIKPCAVVGTSVNYTPDGQWSAYDKGQPVSCTLSVNMSELEPVYASDYTSNENDIRSERLSRDVTKYLKSDGDLYSIKPTEVGY